MGRCSATPDFLAQAWKSIVLAQKSDDRAAFTRFTDDGGGNAGNALGDAKPLVTQFRGMLGA